MHLVIDNVKFSYKSCEALRGVTFELRSSEFLGIVGPNGSGKSTLLKCINKILTPKQGEVLIDGQKVRDMKRYEVARTFGYVPQNAYAGFDKPRVIDIVLMGRRPHITWRYGEKDVEKAWEALSKLGITHLAMRRFDELSGGQQQKVLIARALAQEARVLLLDEPTSNLDIKHQLEVMNLIRNLVNSGDMSAIAAIHDLNLASIYCDKIIIMKDGKIFVAGNPNSVFTPENIREAFGVNVAVHNINERPYIFVTDIALCTSHRSLSHLTLAARLKR